MSELEVVLADCIDLWLDGQDPIPILRKHPEVASEVVQLIRIAQAVRASAELREMPQTSKSLRLGEFFSEGS